MTIFESLKNHTYTQKLISLLPPKKAMTAWFQGWAYSIIANNQIRAYNAIDQGQNHDRSIRTTYQVMISITAFLILKEAYANLGKLVGLTLGFTKLVNLSLILLPIFLTFVKAENLEHWPRLQKSIVFLNVYYPHMLTLTCLFYAGVCLFTGSLVMPGLIVGSLLLGAAKRFNRLSNTFAATLEKTGEILGNIAIVITGHPYMRFLSVLNLMTQISAKLVSDVLLSILSWIPLPFFEKHKRAYIIGAKIKTVSPFKLEGEINTEEEFSTFIHAIAQLPHHPQIRRIKPNRAFVENIKASDTLPSVNIEIENSTLTELFRTRILLPYLAMTPQEAENSPLIRSIMIKLKDDWQTRHEMNIHILKRRALIENEIITHFNARKEVLLEDLNKRDENNYHDDYTRNHWEMRINKMEDAVVKAHLLGVLNKTFAPNHQSRLEQKIRETRLPKKHAQNNIIAQLNAHYPNNNEPKGSTSYWSAQIDNIAYKKLIPMLKAELKRGKDPIEYVLERLGDFIQRIDTGDLPTLIIKKKDELRRMLKAVTHGIGNLSMQPDKTQETDDILVNLGIEAGKYCDAKISFCVDRCYDLILPHLDSRYKLDDNKTMARALGPDRELAYQQYFARKHEKMRNFNPKWKRIKDFSKKFIKLFTDSMRNIFGVDMDGRNIMASSAAPRFLLDFSIESDSQNENTTLDQLHNAGISNMPTLPWFCLPILTHNNVLYEYWKNVSSDSLLDSIAEKFQQGHSLSINEYLGPWFKKLIETSPVFKNKEACQDMLADYDIYSMIVDASNPNRQQISRGFLILLALHTGVLYIDEKNNYLRFGEGPEPVSKPSIFARLFNFFIPASQPRVPAPAPVQGIHLSFGKGEDEKSLDEIINRPTFVFRFLHFLKRCIFGSTVVPATSNKKTKKESLNTNSPNLVPELKITPPPLAPKFEYTKALASKPKRKKKSKRTKTPISVPSMTQSFVL